MNFRMNHMTKIHNLKAEITTNKLYHQLKKRILINLKSIDFTDF